MIGQAAHVFRRGRTPAEVNLYFPERSHESCYVRIEETADAVKISEDLRSLPSRRPDS